MPTPLIPNACKVTVSGSLFGQLVENVWFTQTAGVPTVPDMNTIAGVFQTDYASILVPLSADLTVSQITVRYLGDAAGPETTLFITPAQAGGVGAGSEPSNVALCVSLRSALAGRRFRGRKYFSGIPVGAVTDNSISPTTADPIVNAINGLITDLATAGFPLQIVSFTGLTSVPVVTALVVDYFVDSQRRRLTGRGR